MIVANGILLVLGFVGSPNKAIFNQIVKDKSYKLHPLLSPIDLSTDTAAILISIVSNSYYGMRRGQINVYLPPGHPIIAIRNNKNRNGRRIGKKV